MILWDDLTLMSLGSNAEEQKLIVAEDNTDEDRIEPQDPDVLLGRGKPSFNNPGNALYRRLIYESWDEYQKTDERMDKAIIIQTVKSEIEEANGRFLKFNHKDQSWQVAKDLEVTKKISHALRNRKPPGGHQGRGQRGLSPTTNAGAGILGDDMHMKNPLLFDPLQHRPHFELGSSVFQMPMMGMIPPFSQAPANQSSFQGEGMRHLPPETVQGQMPRQTHEESDEKVEPLPITYGVPLPTFDFEEQQLLQDLLEEALNKEPQL